MPDLNEASKTKNATRRIYKISTDPLVYGRDYTNKRRLLRYEFYYGWAQPWKEWAIEMLLRDDASCQVEEKKKR